MGVAVRRVGASPPKTPSWTSQRGIARSDGGLRSAPSVAASRWLRTRSRSPMRCRRHPSTRSLRAGWSQSMSIRAATRAGAPKTRRREVIIMVGSAGHGLSSGARTGHRHRPERM